MHPTSVASELEPASGWALLAGINNYEDPATHAPLECPVRDAIGLYTLLTHPGFGNLDKEHVVLLLDGTDDEIEHTARVVVARLERRYHFTARPDIDSEIRGKRKRPSRSEILAEINRIEHYADAAGLALVHISSHGYVWNGESYLIQPEARHGLYEDTAVPLSWVRDRLAGSQARHRLLIADLCFSGPDAETPPLPWNEASGSGVWRSLTRWLARRGEATRAAGGIAALTACERTEQCYEDDSHGVFTHYLLEALSGKADRDKKGFVSLKDAFEFVRGRQDLGHRAQHPALADPSP